MVAPTPKFRSVEFRAELASLKTVFDAHSLSVVLVDALERRAAEAVFKRFARGTKGRRIQNIQKTELVGQLTAGFFSSEEVAFQLMKEMDRACEKERHIIASIPEAQASERIGSYRAIALKRERAKFVWALAREDRPAVRDLANKIITEFFSEAADLQTSQKVAEGAEATDALREVDLAKRLTEQAERLQEAAQRVDALESQVTRSESDRATLLAQIGQKERALKAESEARSELEGQLDELRAALGRVESEQAAVEAAQAGEDAARSRAEELANKVRRLTKLAGVSDRLGEARARIDALERDKAALERAVQRAEAETATARSEAASEAAAAQARAEALRTELEAARQRVAELERRPVAEATEGRPAGLLILLDQANLAATAHAEHGRKVNFAALLDALSAGRTVRRAIAFVVDNGGAQFDAFCDTLRRAGWELRRKRPKTFRNGRQKADWDMGMAVEAIERHGEADTVLLVSGDGDFAPLVRWLKGRGARVEVAAFGVALAAELAEVADAVTRLDTGTLE